MRAPCGVVRTRSSLERPLRSISRSRAWWSLEACWYIEPPSCSSRSSELQDDLRISLDPLGEILLGKALERDDGPIAAVEDDLPDEIVQVRITRLEQLTRDVPGFEETAADHRMQGDAVDDEAIEALD